MVCSDTQDGDINLRVAPNETGIKGASIRQRNLDTPCARNNMGIGKNLTIRGKDETRAKATTKARHIESANTLTILVYINAYYRRSNSLRRRSDCMRIGIQSLCILLICTHHLCNTFL